MVEVALIRPGPIQGGSVHPYLRRRNGEEAVTYLHPLLEPCLEKTLGVPLFQEQLMQLAIDAAGFTPGEADQLRQAMGSKRSQARMAAMRERLMAGHGRAGHHRRRPPRRSTRKLEAFADFGFPESHSVSFAYLVYSSSWIKYHYPAEFACALLNAQPMGFYSPHTIVRDARAPRRAGARPDLNASRRDCTLEPRTADAGPIGRPLPRVARRAVDLAVRLGLRYVRGLSDALLDRIDDDARRDAPVHRPRRLHPAHRRDRRRGRGARDRGRVRVLRRRRRAALWAAGALRDARPQHGGARRRCPGVVTGVEAPPLPGMTERRRPPTCGRRACRRVGTPPSSCARSSRARAWSPPTTCATLPTARWWRSAGS